MRTVKRTLCSIVMIMISMGVIGSLAEASIANTNIDLSVFDKTYIVAYAPDYSPYSYDDSDGNPQGMVIEMFDYIAEIARVNIEYVSIEEMKNPGNIDINLSMLAEDTIESCMIQSESYFSFPLIVVGKDEWRSDASNTVGHLGYANLSNEDIQAELGECNTITYHSYSELEDAYNKGKIDYLIVSSIVFSDLELNTGGVAAVETINLELETVFTFSDSMSQEEIDNFNQIIGDINPNDIYRILVEAAMEVPDEGYDNIFLFIMAHKIQSVAILLFIIMICLLFVHKYRAEILLRSVNIDSVTGLLTERKFLEDIPKLLARKREEEEYYIISIDIDKFKYVNELFGTEIGTEVINRIARVIEENLGDEILLFARIVADRFILLVNNVDEIDGQRMKECILNLENAVKELLGEDYRLHTSVGIYVVTNPNLSVHYMTDCANLARESGKDAYGHTFIQFTEALEEKLNSEKNIVIAMEQALINHEFKMVYQPKISLKTSQIVGAEALVRWIKPDGEKIFPNRFIPVLEKNGFIVSLDYYVLDRVCEFLHENKEVPVVSVNFSGYTVLKEHFVERIIEGVEKHNIEPQRIEIEITESAIVESFDIIAKVIKVLKAQGFAVSMDDFGTGVSSLNRLKDIDIDILKIDKKFVDDTVYDEKGNIIMKSIIDMAQSLGIKTVAEGAETDKQIQLLRTLRCDVVQGYYFSRPLEEVDFLEFVKEHL